MERLIHQIQNTPDCTIHPRMGIPTMEADHVLPNDVFLFYQICGGVTLFFRSESAVEIVNPSKFLRANPLIFGKVFPEAYFSRDDEEKLSWSWYVLMGEKGSNDFVTIDCHPLRQGRCYHSNWASHAMKGQSPIIAWSFTEFLTRALNTDGKEWYWEKSDFVPYEDAYGNF